MFLYPKKIPDREKSDMGSGRSNEKKVAIGFRVDKMYDRVLARANQKKKFRGGGGNFTYIFLLNPSRFSTFYFLFWFSWWSQLFLLNEFFLFWRKAINDQLGKSLANSWAKNSRWCNYEIVQTQNLNRPSSSSISLSSCPLLVPLCTDCTDRANCATSRRSNNGKTTKKFCLWIILSPGTKKCKNLK